MAAKLMAQEAEAAAAAAGDPAALAALKKRGALPQEGQAAAPSIMADKRFGCVRVQVHVRACSRALVCGGACVCLSVCMCVCVCAPACRHLCVGHVLLPIKQLQSLCCLHTHLLCKPWRHHAEGLSRGSKEGVRGGGDMVPCLFLFMYA